MATGAPDYTKRIVLYGVDENGVTVPVLVDASGRIVMIMSDATDPWGKNISMGLGELAACLGVPKRFDRRGEVQFYENFGYGTAHFLTGTSGAGAAVEASNERGISGGASIKLTGGSDDDRYAQLKAFYASVGETAMGVELWCNFVSYADYIQLLVNHWFGTKYYGYGIQYDPTAETVKYLDSNSNWVLLADDINLSTSDLIFHPFKLVTDPENGCYRRLLIDNHAWDMSSIAAGSALASHAYRFDVAFRLVSQAGYNAHGYVDDLVITKNEPA